MRQNRDISQRRIFFDSTIIFSKKLQGPCRSFNLKSEFGRSQYSLEDACLGFQSRKST